MWKLGNRSVIVLVSVLSGCVFLYNVWGPILILTISLFFTIYACYSLIINDTLLSPHAFLLLDYCKHFFSEVRTSFETIIDHIYQYIRQFLETANRQFRKRYLTQTYSRMERRRGLNYQLSSDPYPTRKNSAHFEPIAELSPISKNLQKANVSDDINFKNNFYHNSGHSPYDHNSFITKRTSIRTFPRNKEELENQTFKLSPCGQMLSKRSPIYGQNHAMMQMEDTKYFDAEGSSWNFRTNSKADTKTEERTDVQAGPLLSSTRYNIDPKVYNDVTSPGLTSRLTKYVAEANNKLTHQSKYHVGQFPKVNLHATSVPLINAKSVKTRTPVTVRVAPSHTIRCSPSKQNILTNSHQSDSSCFSPSVAQVLREISLKRHASREDVTSDLAKKQRTDGIINKKFETQDETKQKRSREESLKSEDDTSPQSKTIRPTKRTKTPSCYDIINSLSSSKHVVSGVKRKARDFSRSGTPDFEKHFKSLECVQNASTQTLVQVSNASPKHHNHEITEKKNNSDVCNSVGKLPEYSPLKGILKTSNKSIEYESDDNFAHTKYLNTQNNDKDHSIKSMIATDSTKLTHKLFMRAEPERNEKLRMLVEEQGNIRAKFTTDDVEEIKKEDIADMRQTSMRARLQSMFDAISGKAASQINPDVVIQAEEVNIVKPVACPVTCVTLNSSTTTTNVNTTPISTSAVAPNPGTSEFNTKSPKHVTFNLSDKDSSSNTNFATIFKSKNESISTSVSGKIDNAAPKITLTSTKSEIISQSIISNTTTSSPISSNVQTFNFDKSASVTSTANTSPIRVVDSVSANNKPLSVISTTSSIFGNFITTTPISSPVSMSTTITNAKTEANQNISKSISQSTTNSNVSIGNNNLIFTSTHSNSMTSSTIVKSKEQSLESTSIATKINMTPFTSITNIANSNNTSITTSTITTSIVSTSNVTTSTPLFTFGNNANKQVMTSKSEGFVFGSVGKTSENNGAFGCVTTSQQVSIITNTVMTSSNNQSNTQTNSITNITTSTGFQSNAKTSIPTFGSSTNSTFVSSTISSTNDSKPGFSFNNTSSAANTVTGNSNTNSNTTLFTIGNNNSNSSFGTPSSITSCNTAQFVSNTGSIFTNSSSTQSIFGATTTNSNQSVFGTPSSSNTTTAIFTLPKSTITSVFGSNVSTTSTGFASTNSMPIFSNIGGSSIQITNTTSIPVFGSSTSLSTSGITSSGTNSVGSNLFSNVNSTTSTSIFPTTNNIFGQTNSTGNFKNNPGVFGNNSGSALFGSHPTTSSTFATANVSSNSTVSTFGSTNISVSNASVPTFGATNTVTSDFGSQNQNKGNSDVQNSDSQNFGVRNSIFRGENTAGPVFGASNSGTNHFNSSASNNTFSGQNTSISSNPTFGMAATGTPNGTATFGDNKVSPFGSQSSTFGTPNITSPTFGNTNANESNTTSNIFTFGANQKPPQQSTTVFPFGTNSNTNNNATIGATASTSSPFQFGTTTSNSATGFNFSAPSTTPSINFGTTSSTSTFNAPTPGMFSIGSGSTAPRSRNIRTRKLR